MISVLFTLLSSISVFAAGAAVEPVNPESVCERFLKPVNQASCVKKAKSMDLDWYAVSVCDKVDDDDAFLDCWKKINGHAYSPASLASCAGDMADADRIGCLVKAGAGSGRAPASGSAKKAKPVYQPLKIGK